MTRFLLSISLIPAGLAAGLILQYMTERSSRPQLLTGKIKKAIQTISLLLLNPVAFTGAVWILPLHYLEMIFLPVLGVAAISLGGIYSVIYSSKKSMTRPRRGSHFCVSYYTNIGSIGGLIIYALLGEPGFTLLPFYKLLELAMRFNNMKSHVSSTLSVLVIKFSSSSQ